MWHRTPVLLRMLGKPAWRVEGFGGFWFYSSRPWPWSQTAQESNMNHHDHPKTGGDIAGGIVAALIILAVAGLVLALYG